MIAIVMLANTSIVSPNEVRDVVQETGIKTIPIEKKCKKAKWLSGEALQIPVKRRETKSKGEKERYKHLNAEFQRIARRDKKAFFTVQLSHLYMTTGKTTALTRRTFVGRVMSLLLNMLSMLVITFLPRSKHLLISWPQSPSAVILESPKIKSGLPWWLRG